MATVAIGSGLLNRVRPRTKELKTFVELNAPPERVWRTLTAFAAFPLWNPFIREASGELKEGARLRVKLELHGSRPWVFRPTLLRFEPNRELRWLGRLFIGGLFDGEHRFLLEPKGGGTRLVQAETFSGWLLPLLWPSLEQGTRRGFEEMNRALKARVEEPLSTGV
jgi:hypothetical protein